MLRGRSTRGTTALLTTIVVAIFSTGCLPELKPGFDSPAPSKRLDAIVDASRLEDDESLVKLVEKLRSPVPAERMFAIRSLEIRTGQTLDYDHAAQHWQRIAAYNDWLDWLSEQGITLPEDMTPQPEQPGTPEEIGDEKPMESETDKD